MVQQHRLPWLGLSRGRGARGCVGSAPRRPQYCDTTLPAAGSPEKRRGTPFRAGNHCGPAGEPSGPADRQRGFLAPLVRRARRLRGALGRDRRGRRVRLPAHRLRFHRRHDDHAAAAADGPVRRLHRRHRRADGAARHADRRGRQHGDHVAGAGDPGASATARQSGTWRSPASSTASAGRPTIRCGG